MTTNSTPLPTREPSREGTRGSGRVYRGSSVEELIPMIQAELGPDAIVLGRRAGLTGGVGGFFQRRFVEIEAQPGRPGIDVYDEDTATPTPTQSHPAAASAAARTTAQPPAGGDATATQLAGDFRELVAPTVLRTDAAIGLRGDRAAIAPHSNGVATEPHGNGAADSFAATLASFGGAADTVQAARVNGSGDAPADARSLAERTVASGPRDAATHPHRDPQTTRANGSAAPRHARARARIERSLLDRGVSEEFVRELIDGAAAHLVPLPPRVGLARAVQIALQRRIPARPPLPAGGGMLVLVGPGGSGKTSCATKLLRAYNEGGQLPTSYATIVRGAEGSGLELLFSPTILTPVPVTAARAARALASARGGALTVLDTPPLSTGDRAAIRELASLAGSLRPERVVVTLPATLGATAAAQLLGALCPLRPSAVAITHADETDQLGVAVEAACRFGLAPEYMLDRAHGRGRLTRVDPAQLAQRLLG